MLPRKIAVRNLYERVKEEMKGFENLIGFDLGSYNSKSVHRGTAMLIFTSEPVFLQKLVLWKK